MNAGRLKHWVELEAPSTSQDSFGQPTEVFLRRGRVRAGIEPLTGRELLQAAAAATAVGSVRIVLRYFPGLDASWRLRWVDREGRTHLYSINSAIDPKERGRELELLCTEITIERVAHVG
jgi:SPP1 family predicted phage head-tail adaptor